MQVCVQGKFSAKMAETALLSINGLNVGFLVDNSWRKAVSNVSLELPRGKVSCLVGESGCGKSLTCRSILRLLPENASVDGRILFQGQNILTLSDRNLRRIRGAAIGMIFQEPMTSLNPVLTIGDQSVEPLRLHKHMKRREAKQRVLELFRQVGIPSPESRYNDYPHQLSGGMRQRVMIAMALSCGPDLLLADEPTTALDATIQGQILRLLRKESRERGMAVLLITHDLGVVADMAHYVGVMYAGHLVEYAEATQLFANPLHPYTRGLLACAPDSASFLLSRLPVIPGHVPSLSQTPPGCPFQPRCAQAIPVCSTQMPATISRNGQRVACWLYLETSETFR